MPSLDLTFGGRRRIPLIAAPMFLVSSPEMALAACSQGVMGSFPAHSTRSREVFADWLDQMTRGMQELRDQEIEPAPYGVNLVVHRTNERYPGDLALCIQHEVSVILTSKGAPEDVFRQIHDLRRGRLPRHRLPPPRREGARSRRRRPDRRLQRRRRPLRHPQPGTPCSTDEGGSTVARESGQSSQTEQEQRGIRPRPSSQPWSVV